MSQLLKKIFHFQKYYCLGIQICVTFTQSVPELRPQESIQINHTWTWIPSITETERGHLKSCFEELPCTISESLLAFFFILSLNLLLCNFHLLFLILFPETKENKYSPPFKWQLLKYLEENYHFPLVFWQTKLILI